MFCLKMEKSVLTGTVGINDYNLSGIKGRKNNPDEVVIYYEGDCILIGSRADYEHRVPVLQTAKGSMECIKQAVENEELEESFIHGTQPAVNGKMLVFDNGARFKVSNQLYNSLLAEFGDESELVYSTVCEYMYMNCA